MKILLMAFRTSKAENISTEFALPVTHWIGAEMKGDKAYFRGLIDADATNLKDGLELKG